MSRRFMIASLLSLSGILVACGSSNSAKPPVTSTTNSEQASDDAAASSANALPSDAPVTPPSTTPTTPALPAGYPKVVPVSSLPEQPRSAMVDTYTQAVAIYPGVWTPLPPGASVEDAVASGPLDGFCASLHAYEAKYLNGESRGGECW